MLLRLAYSYMGSTADADDILQDVMVAFMRFKPEFSGDEHAKAWFLRTCINACKNKLKSPWRKIGELTDNLPDPASGFTEEETAVTAAVAALSVKYREVIHLYYYEGYQTAEIADILGKRDATVRSILYRGRKLLKNKLGGVEL